MNGVMKDPIPLLKEDLFLFGNNVLSLTCSSLKSLGVSSGWLGNVSNITYIATTLGESLISAKTFNEFSSALPSVALAGARLLVFRAMADHPVLKSVAFAINAYGTYAIARRAIAEFSQCKSLLETFPGNKYHWEILRNSLVHGVNVSCSAYKTTSLFKEYFSSQSDSVNQQNGYVQGFYNLVHNDKGLSDEELACRTLYYDPTCESISEVQSDCSPSCKGVDEKGLRTQYQMMRSVHGSMGVFDKTEGSLRSALRVLTNIKGNFKPQTDGEREEAKTLAEGIRKFGDLKLDVAEEDEACRILYYDPSCSTIHAKESDCIPVCEGLSEEQIEEQFKKMEPKVNRHWDVIEQVRNAYGLLRERANVSENMLSMKRLF